jgi:hypothetical protein
MHDNPAEDWQALAENYRQMDDVELRELAADFGDLTSTAQEVLRTELRNRRLAEPGAKPVAESAPPQKPKPAAPEQWTRSVDPDAAAEQGDEPAEDEGDSSPSEFTWKTPLCDCETTEQAWGLSEALKRAGIDSWVEQPGRNAVSGLRVVVAADQLEEAREIASRPIPQEIIEEYEQEAPEFVAPSCPACGAEDPVLESADPSNCWLCEVCGKQWSEPVAGADEDSRKAGN